ncbi:TadE/TadG family type IV pilus assembly protein [Propionibacteriaceae bacterium G1746]|uniref:TadE/TadG family type IV pilus assembly protein n=1 Tax=Aestuariimicrobium sp. G57 TaxID=3418485 RepID=UPI003C14E2C8
MPTTPDPRHHHGHRHRRAHRDRGLGQTVQWALLTPLLVMMMVGLVQGAVVLQARQAAKSAAMAGAEAESWHGSPRGTGAEVAQRAAAGSGLHDVTVTVTRQGGLARVTVTGRPDLFFDVGQGRVSATAVMPLEGS